VYECVYVIHSLSVCVCVRVCLCECVSKDVCAYVCVHMRLCTALHHTEMGGGCHPLWPRSIPTIPSWECFVARALMPHHAFPISAGVQGGPGPCTPAEGGHCPRCVRGVPWPTTSLGSSPRCSPRVSSWLAAPLSETSARLVALPLASFHPSPSAPLPDLCKSEHWPQTPLQPMHPHGASKWHARLPIDVNSKWPARLPIGI